jgi:hypothetical protein
VRTVGTGARVRDRETGARTGAALCRVCRERLRTTAGLRGVTLGQGSATLQVGVACVSVMSEATSSERSGGR